MLLLIVVTGAVVAGAGAVMAVAVVAGVVAVVAGAVAGAMVAAAGAMVSEAGAGAGAVVAVAVVIINFLLILIFIAYRTYQEDPQFSYLYTLGLQIVTFSSTRFNNANLTDTCFYQANLKHAHFVDAILVRTNFRKAKNLKLAYVKNTILEQKAVRELLVHGKTEQQTFIKMDLYGAYLVEANLQTIDFTDANFNQADLSGTNLRNANLTRIQAIGTNFENADLTGACLEAWNIDSTTNIKNVQADYVYLQNDKQERRPNSGIFSAGEFSKLFQELLDTVDLIFKQGEFNLQILAKTLDELRDKLHFQADDGQEIAVKTIEDKGDGIFVVRITVPQGIDKATIHENLMQEYYQFKALVSQQKDEIKYLRGSLTDMIRAPKSDTYIQSQAQVNNTGQQNMFDKNERNINIGGSVSQSNINVADHAHQTMNVSEASSNEPPIEIINQIQDLIDRTQILEESQRQGMNTMVGLVKNAILQKQSYAQFIPAVRTLIENCPSEDFQREALSKMTLLEKV